MFHQMHEPTSDEVKSGKVREFVGDGGSKLKLPGLIGEPTAVRIGSIDLPARVDVTFIDNKLNGKTVSTDMPLLKLDRDSHDCPVLLRSQRSNDGYWQKDVKVHVWGEWEDDPSSKPVAAETAAPEPAPDPAAVLRAKLESLSPANLAQAAKRVGVETGADKEETISRILAKTAEPADENTF